MKNLTSQTKTLILALVLTLGISYVSAASTWQAPTVAAPGGNTDVPLNVGSNAQSKQGDLAVGAFLANLNSQILGNLTIGATSSSASLIIPKGASAGKVLTALDSTGAAVWATSTGGGGSVGGWVEIPLDTTTKFDANCEYRSYAKATQAEAFGTEGYGYFNTITTDRITYMTHGTTINYTPYNDKTHIYITNTGVNPPAATVYGNIVYTKIEKRCGGGGSWTGTSTGGYAFGGIYMVNEENDGPTFTPKTCRYGNAITGSCTCPTGFTTSRFWDWVVPSNTVSYYSNPPASVGVTHMYMCWANGGGVPAGPSGTSGGFTNLQVFDTAGVSTWVVPAGITKIKVKVWGAGGGGTGRIDNCAPQQCSGGGTFVPLAGGGGAYAEDIIDVVPETSHTITVGAGGTTEIFKVLTNGSKSSFDALVVAGGGMSATSGGNGAGGTATAGRVRINGGSDGSAPSGGTPNIKPGGGGVGPRSSMYVAGASGRVIIEY